MRLLRDPATNESQSQPPRYPARVNLSGNGSSGRDARELAAVCCPKFNNIMGAIAAMDADAVSIGASRSQMELLDAFEGFCHSTEIDPVAWAIYSPRVPDDAEPCRLLALAQRRILGAQPWAALDCGFKPRG